MNQSPYTETHTQNFCLDCLSGYDRGSGSCPKCGSDRRRAYLKPEEIKRKEAIK